MAHRDGPAAYLTVDYGRLPAYSAEERAVNLWLDDEELIKLLDREQQDAEAFAASRRVERERRGTRDNEGEKK